MKKNSAGYTVAELVIAIALSAMVVTVLSSMIINMYRQIQISRATAELNSESVQLLRAIVDDTRLAGGLLSTNSLEDPYQPAEGWITNDPSNILIISSPAIDSSANVIYEPSTGLPYKNETIYFSEGTGLYKRILRNPQAENNTAESTCPTSATNCKKDREYTRNLKDLSFTFYDENGQTTAEAINARSVSFVATLEKKVSGKVIKISNSTRTTLRNR